MTTTTAGATMTTITATDDLEQLLNRPTFAVPIWNGDNEQVATIVATSTADALATFLDRLPGKGRESFERNAVSLHRKDGDAYRRWELWGDEPVGRQMLTCPRYVGYDPSGETFYFAAYGAVEL